MRVHTGIIIGWLALALSSQPAQPLAAAEFEFLPDHPGGFSATATVSNVPVRKLSKADAAAFKKKLEQLRNLLAKQPALQAPKGVEIIGYFRPLDEFPTAQNLPVPGFGYLRFHFYHRAKNGKPVRICCTTDEIHASINDPDQSFEVYGSREFATKTFYEPDLVGQVDGFPLYRTAGGDELLVFSRGTARPWLPVTREEYVTAWLTFWQKQVQESVPQDTITPEIVRRHQQALAQMKPEERTMQARSLTWDVYEPTLAPVGSAEGRPLVRVNPDWFDPSLPRSAIQLLVLRFSTTGLMDPIQPGPSKTGSVSAYRVWQVLHSSNWKEVSTVLTTR